MHTDNPESTDEDGYDDLPEPLIRALRSADQRPAVITSRVDREIAALAVAQFTGRRPGIWRSRPAWTALAASVLIAVAALLAVYRGEPDAQPGEIYADIDGSGRIDIADVLALARDAGSNGVSRAEIDAFAARIVALGRAGDAT